MEKEKAFITEYGNDLINNIEKYLIEQIPNGYTRHKVIIVKIIDLD